MNRILVTGGSGQLGSYVVRALHDNYQVTVFDLQQPTEPCGFIQGSILDRPTLSAAVNNQDAVIHLAALDAGVSATDGEFMRVNVEGTWNLFEIAQSAGISKIVHCSSVAALNISRQNPPRYLPVDVAHPADPKSAYGLSKLIGEKIAHRFATQEMQVICLRPALVMQPEIVYDVARLTALADGTTIPPQASHSTWRALGESISGSRAFIDPRDAAAAFKAALEVEGIAWGIFFVAASESYSLLATMTVLERELGVQPTITGGVHYPADSRACMYDILSIENQLGWKPAYRWQTVVDAVLNTAD